MRQGNKAFEGGQQTRQQTRQQARQHIRQGNGLVSIIVLNWNGLGFTKRCLKLLGEKTAYRPYEIIVVDNGSSDGSVAFLKEMKRKKAIQELVLNKSNIGFGPANNQGMAISKGDYVFLLNNDTIVTENWLKNMVKVAESKAEIGIVGPHFPLVKNPLFVFGGGFVDDAGRSKSMYNKQDAEAELISGGAFLVKRAVVDRIGFFDKGFAPIYFEESDYCARARRAGFKVFFTAKSRILHDESASTKKQAGRWRFVTVNKNRIRYVLIHFPKARLAKFFLWEALRFGKSLAGLNAHWLLQAWAINLRNLAEIARKRKDYKKGNVFLGEVL